MSTASQFQPISVRDYLAGEQQAKRKHEYVNGAVYAMAEGTVRHNRIASNIMGTLFAQLRGHRCQAFSSDMKIRVRLSSGTRFYYPDVSVVCHSNAASDVFQDSPAVIVEVISESTRRTDEFEKCEAYLTIDALSVYLLVEQASESAQLFRRADSGFSREIYRGAKAIIPLPEIGCELALAEIYQQVEFNPAGSEDDLESS